MLKIYVSKHQNLLYGAHEFGVKFSKFSPAALKLSNYFPCLLRITSPHAVLEQNQMVSQIVLRSFLVFALSFESKIEKTFREREENNNILSRILSI